MNGQALSRRPLADRKESKHLSLNFPKGGDGEGNRRYDTFENLSKEEDVLRKIAVITFCALMTAECLGDFMVKKISDPKVKFETTQGVFTVQLFRDVTVTAQNFVNLVSSGFYNGLAFHRYVPDFVIQGGDPNGDGSGGSDKTIPLEITAHKHVKGALGMARSSDPNSASSQFYICLKDENVRQLDGGYCVFGKVISGMDVVMKLRQGDKMNKVTLLKESAPKKAAKKTSPGKAQGNGEKPGIKDKAQ